MAQRSAPIRGTSTKEAPYSQRMSAFAQAKHETSLGDYIDKDSLYAANGVFTILSIQPGTSKFGSVWHAKVEITAQEYEEDEIVGVAEDGTGVMTYSGGTRDELMAKLRTSCPHYNITLEKIKATSGDFYDLVELTEDDALWTEPIIVRAKEERNPDRRTTQTERHQASRPTNGRHVSRSVEAQPVNDDPFLPEYPEDTDVVPETTEEASVTATRRTRK
jgi:hypothetical protein